MTKKLDHYELRARVAPGLVLSLPLLVLVGYAVPGVRSIPVFAAGGICSFAMIYTLGQFSRARGEAIEATLWKSWGGPPSTRFLRPNDKAFGSALKEKIAAAVFKKFSLRLPQNEDYAKDPFASDQAIDDVFRLVRNFLRKNDPRGLWYHHMVEYGFARNLMGARVAWAVLSLVAFLASSLLTLQRGWSSAGVPLIITGTSMVASVYVGWFVLPGSVRRIANGYAELAWAAFLALHDGKRASTVKKARTKTAVPTAEENSP
jgi:hypothetical protein